MTVYRSFPEVLSARLCLPGDAMVSRSFVALVLSLLVGVLPSFAQPMRGPAPIEALPGVNAEPIISEPAFVPTPAQGGATDLSTLEIGSAVFANAEGLLDESRAWFSAEYLMWWMRPGEGRLPLATSGPAGTAGLVGRSGVQALLGNESTLTGPLSGFRIGMGMWLSPRSVRTFGFEVNGFFMPDRTETNTVSGTPQNDLARPFYDPILRGENSRIIASPGLFVGSITSRTTTQAWGLDIGPVFRVVENGPWSLDQLLGFKVFGLDEAYQVNDISSATLGGLISFNGISRVAGGTVAVNDIFQTRNRFYGGSVGSRLNYSGNRWFGSAGGRVAGGIAQQSMNIDGSTTFLAAGSNAPQMARGGFLVNSGMIGQQNRSQFAFLGEVNLKLGFRFTQRLIATVGYDYVHITRIARPDQNLSREFSSNVPPSDPNFGQQLQGGGIAPSAGFRASDFWMHGLSFGAEWRY